MRQKGNKFLNKFTEIHSDWFRFVKLEQTQRRFQWQTVYTIDGLEIRDVSDTGWQKHLLFIEYSTYFQFSFSAVPTIDLSGNCRAIMQQEHVWIETNFNEKVLSAILVYFTLLFILSRCREYLTLYIMTLFVSTHLAEAAILQPFSFKYENESMKRRLNTEKHPHKYLNLCDEKLRTVNAITECRLRCELSRVILHK